MLFLGADLDGGRLTLGDDSGASMFWDRGLPLGCYCLTNGQYDHLAFIVSTLGSLSSYETAGASDFGVIPTAVTPTPD
jgi:hypothetical protein